MVRYNSPLGQVLIISSVCFLCPGMFNALNGLGGAGQLDTSTSNNANTALYATFCVFSILGGGIVNVCGVRYPTAAACLTYAFYTGSYVFYNHTGHSYLTIVAGCVLGIGAGVLWAAQGVVMVAYPMEHEKGRFISIFWVIFNLGGLIGGLLPFALNFYHSGSLTDAVYLMFVMLECFGALMALMLAPSTEIIRNNGTRASIVDRHSVRRESVEIIRLLGNKWMLLLLPMSFTSNFFYGYQFSQYNAAIFTLRTRSFNNLLYWLSQIIGSFVLSLLLDASRWPRQTRGCYAVLITSLAFNAVWAATLVVQLRYTRGMPDTDYTGGPVDFLQGSRAVGPIFLYFFMGMVDAWYQNVAYWVIGTLTNDTKITARYIGFYKGVQSLGAAVSWQIGARKVPFLNQVIGNWILLLVSLPTMFYTVTQIEDKPMENQLAFALMDDDSSIIASTFESDLISRSLERPCSAPASSRRHTQHFYHGKT